MGENFPLLFSSGNCLQPRQCCTILDFQGLGVQYFMAKLINRTTSEQYPENFNRSHYPEQLQSVIALAYFFTSGKVLAPLLDTSCTKS